MKQSVWNENSLLKHLVQQALKNIIHLMHACAQILEEIEGNKIVPDFQCLSNWTSKHMEVKSNNIRQGE